MLSLARALVYLFNFKLLLLPSDSPPPFTPALFSDPNFSRAIFVLYPAVVASFNGKIQPSDDSRQAVDEQEAEDGCEDSDKSSKECDR